MPSLCSLAATCAENTSSSLDSVSGVTKMVGIVLGSVLGLAFFACFVGITYLLFCKRVPQPNPPPTIPPQASPQKITEDAPPAYEEINTIGRSA